MPVQSRADLLMVQQRLLSTCFHKQGILFSQIRRKVIFASHD
jgi:hypothetical protein